MSLSTKTWRVRIAGPGVHRILPAANLGAAEALALRQATRHPAATVSVEYRRHDHSPGVWYATKVITPSSEGT